ncbi:MAG: DNA polymerase III subunit delta [Microlunatus sp.]|nr:DNA polymerase III subunit delta [Microlunatus sp.]
MTDWHAETVARPQRSSTPYGTVTLVTGPERLLAERAIAAVIERARTESPTAEVDHASASLLDAGRLAELTSPSLFSTRRVAVLDDLADLPNDLVAQTSELATIVDGDLALVLVHNGAARNKKLVETVKATKPELVGCPAVKSWELPQFVSGEVRRLGGTVEKESAQLLIDAVGHDLRALAAAVAQLLADSETDTISGSQVRRYFGGRAEVTSFAVADATLSGRTGAAMEQLRWALSTGVAPVLVTSAFASGLRGLGRLTGARGSLREADLAREVGVPPWKLKTMRSQARGWDQGGLARALQAVAVADAQVKGAAGDAEFALEQLVLAVAGYRRH